MLLYRRYSIGLLIIFMVDIGVFNPKEIFIVFFFAMELEDSIGAYRINILFKDQ